MPNPVVPRPLFVYIAQMGEMVWFVADISYTRGDGSRDNEKCTVRTTSNAWVRVKGQPALIPWGYPPTSRPLLWQWRGSSVGVWRWGSLPALCWRGLVCHLASPEKWNEPWVKVERVQISEFCSICSTSAIKSSASSSSSLSSASAPCPGIAIISRSSFCPGAPL